MTVTRIFESPRSTKPYPEEIWRKIDELGEKVDQELDAEDIRLTMGGEPTFVSIDDMDGAQWNTEAIGEEKLKLSEVLLRKLSKAWAPGALLHYGQGKWYPGESLPRWALGCYWRKDGEPTWKDDRLLGDPSKNYGTSIDEARQFITQLAENLGVDPGFIKESYEDIFYYLYKEQRLPVNVDPQDSRLKDAEERRRLTQTFERGLGEVVGFVLPLQYGSWISGPWPFRGDHMYLLPGDSPAGLRLPLDSLPWVSKEDFPASTILRTPWPVALLCRNSMKANRLSADTNLSQSGKMCAPSLPQLTIPNRSKENQPPGSSGLHSVCSPVTDASMSSCRLSTNSKDTLS